MAYGLSNGRVTDDVTWPWKVKLVTSIRLERNISKTAGDIERLRSKGPPIWNDIWGIKWWRHVTPQWCCEVLRSAILATAWFLGSNSFRYKLVVSLPKSSVVTYVWMHGDDSNGEEETVRECTRRRQRRSMQSPRVRPHRSFLTPHSHSFRQKLPQIVGTKDGRTVDRLDPTGPAFSAARHPITERPRRLNRTKRWPPSPSQPPYLTKGVN